MAKIEKLTLKVPGKPVTKNRPRAVINPKTGKPIVFGIDGFSENKIVTYMKDKFPKELIKGPIKLTITFMYPYPKWITSKKLEQYKEIFGSEILPKTSKPDGDNLLKFVKDSLNEYFWKDDSQVYEEQVYKFFGPTEDPYTLIEIEYIETDFKELLKK